MFSEQGILTNVSLNYLELKAYREVNLKPLFISVRRYNWAETVLNRKGFQLGNDYNFKYPLMLFMNFLIGLIMNKKMYEIRIVFILMSITILLLSTKSHVILGI